MLFKIVHIHTSLLAVRFFLMGWATLSLIFIRKQPKENTVMPRSLRSFFRFVLAEFFFCVLAKELFAGYVGVS